MSPKRKGSPRSSVLASYFAQPSFILEDKYQFERSIASAVSAKVAGKLKHHHRSFGAFPLVEDDLDALEPDVAVDYITPKAAVPFAVSITKVYTPAYPPPAFSYS